MSQTPGDQDPTTATSGNLTLTLTPTLARMASVCCHVKICALASCRQAASKKPGSLTEQAADWRDGL
jgi:hypothetical protein